MIDGAAGLISLVLVAFYVLLLFWIAYRADHQVRDDADRKSPLRLYGWSLAVYCTSWTYFGAVGSAAQTGWDYLPIYLGPILVMLLGGGLWGQLLRLVKRERSGSVADFVSTRLGHSPRLGALAAFVSILSALPYIALQLKSLVAGGQLLFAHDPARVQLAGGDQAFGWVLVIAVVLGSFAVLFGAQRADLTIHNRGLIAAIAFESKFKLIALLTVTVFALTLLGMALWRTGSAAAAQTLFQTLSHPFEQTPGVRFWVSTLFAALAMICVPRQFYVGFVQAPEASDWPRARHQFAFYLLLTSLAVPPIVMVGRLFPGVFGVHSDLHILAIPLWGAGPLFAALVFVGGFSAASAMVVVESLALSAVVSNALILPVMRFLRAKGQPGRVGDEAGDLGAVVLQVRRVSIFAILGLACIYYLFMDQGQSLSAIGLVAFAGAAQLAPALLGALYWRGGRSLGAFAGMAVGTGLWAQWLALPLVFPDYFHGLHLAGLDDLSFSALTALGVNGLVFWLVSIWSQQYEVRSARALAQGFGEGASVGDLKSLLSRFLGVMGALRGLEDHALTRGRVLQDQDPIDAALARAAERLLAGAIGPVSARSVMSALLSGEGLDPEFLDQWLNETVEVVQFNRDLLQAALDHMPQAVSVVDLDLRLVAWNQNYLDLFSFPSGFIHVGRPISDVIRYNALKGECGPGEVEAHVERRLDHLRRRNPHAFERMRPDGRTIRSAGAPMPGGGYVTTYTDITGDKRREAALRAAALALEQSNEQLEARVIARTSELELAKHQAEQATRSKTRFLAAASHDLLQPLHAARLFAAALGDELAEQVAHSGDEDFRLQRQLNLARDVDRAMGSADRLLKALLNLSRLEAGGISPRVKDQSLEDLLADIRREFAPLAAQKGLWLKVMPTRLHALTDGDLLRSAVQNLVSNAIRYTDHGGVVVGVRRQAEGRLRLEVWDQGRGIAPEDQARIFKEFQRATEGPGGGDEWGVGLGLAIVERVAQLLDHKVSLKTTLGRGSCFALELPRLDLPLRPSAPPPIRIKAQRSAPRGQSLVGLKVLCVDDEPAILSGQEALLTRWGAEVLSFERPDSVLDHLEAVAGYHVALVDLRLGGPLNGLDLISALRDIIPHRVLVSAELDGAPQWLDPKGIPPQEQARLLGADVMKKPVEPLMLRAYLTSRHAAIMTDRSVESRP